MKKHIISLLLVMVITLTMTACVANADASIPTTESAIIATVVPNEYEGLVKPIWYDEIAKMNSEEISEYISELVEISNGKDLSLEDMRDMAWNFACIWQTQNISSIHEANFKTQFSTAFDNIFAQTVEQQIPLDTLTGWTYVPDASVMCKYLSSSNFDEPDNAKCFSFKDLTDEEKIRVAKAFFENPLLSFNSSVPSTIICNSPSENITNIAWEHFVTLSKSTDTKLSWLYHTQRILIDIYCNTNGNQDTQKLVEIEKNILENANFDFLMKYSFFLRYIEDEKFFNIAFDTLLELAQNADQETTLLINELVEILDEEHAQLLLNALEKHYIDT